MEVKANLLKPYTKEEEINFVMYYGQDCKGELKETYIIKETETELQALGYTKEELAEQEKERIKTLKCTKRVLALMLQEYGISYKNQLKPLIEANEQAQLEWELCVELERSNPLLDQLGAQLNITSEQIDMIFKVANGEKTLADLKALKGV